MSYLLLLKEPKLNLIYKNVEIKISDFSFFTSNPDPVLSGWRDEIGLESGFSPKSFFMGEGGLEPDLDLL